jgi:hypothetical protein
MGVAEDKIVSMKYEADVTGLSRHSDTVQTLLIESAECSLAMKRNEMDTWT